MATQSLRIQICLNQNQAIKKPCMIPLLSNNDKLYKKLIQLSKQKLQNKVKTKVEIFNYDIPRKYLLAQIKIHRKSQSYSNYSWSKQARKSLIKISTDCLVLNTLIISHQVWFYHRYNYPFNDTSNKQIVFKHQNKSIDNCSESRWSIPRQKIKSG